MDQQAFTLATATTSAASALCTATVGDTSVTVNVARDLTVASGDVLLLTKVGTQWFAVSRVWSAAVTPPTDNAPAPDPKPPTTSGTLVCNPVETRSYRNSAWRTDNTSVYQGEFGGNGNHTGCSFYGSKPRSLAGATVTSAHIRVSRISGGVFAAQTSTMRLMTNATKPAGAPTLTSSTTGPSLAVDTTNASFAVPTSWVQAMVDGTSGGLAFFVSGGSPYIRFAGLGDASGAFALSINWTR